MAQPAIKTVLDNCAKYGWPLLAFARACPILPERAKRAANFATLESTLVALIAAYTMADKMAELESAMLDIINKG